MKITAVIVLIAANAAVYLLQLATNGQIEIPLALWPLQPYEGHVYFHVWQIVTYSFLHDIHNYFHLLFNMFALWMFGAEIERYVGPRAVADLLLRFGGYGCAGATVGSRLWYPRRSARPWAHPAAFLVCCWPTHCCFRSAKSFL